MSIHPPPAQPLMQALSLLEIKLAKLEQRSFEQEKELQARETLIQALRAEIVTLREQNLAALHEIDQRGVRLHEMQKGYETSTSWRVTKPLRWMMQRFSGVKAAGADRTENQHEIHPSLPSPMGENSQNLTLASHAPPLPTEGETPKTAVADRHDYVEWVARYDTTSSAQQARLAANTAKIQDLSKVSLLSVLTAPLSSDLDLSGMQAVRDSLIRQQHVNWEWLIVCAPESYKRLQGWVSIDARIRLINAEVNEAEPFLALNAGLHQSSGEWLAWIDDRVLLREHALSTALEHLHSNPTHRILYADDDCVDGEGVRSKPAFRCEANFDLLTASDYLGQLILCRREDMVDAGGWRTSLRAGQRHDLLLRLTDRWEAPAKVIAHIPQILSHRSCPPVETEFGQELLLTCWQQSVAQAPANDDSLPELVQAHLSRRGQKGDALPHPSLSGAFRVRFTLPAPPPRVSIVIPTRDNVGVLSVCLESLLQKSTYPDLRVVVVDNGSVKPETLAYLAAIEDPRVQVIKDDAPFNFSRLINLGASAVEGEVLCLLNNDMQITQPDWLEEMVGWALQDGVAAVGARLWYGEGTLQHGGIVLGIQGVAGHAHKHLAKGDPGYLNRAVLHQTMSAVTGACMVVRRSVFDEVGGFDEALGVAYNDVDFCLRARKAGYRNVWTPHAEMIHHESVSRGFEDSPEKQARFQREAALMRERWADWLDNDPAYNPNLTLEHEDFGLAWPPRASVT